MKTGIALFVYNRPEHTKEVLEGLKKNRIDKLYIFFDGLKTEVSRKEWEAVENVIDNIEWCETEIIKSEKNKGLANSIIFGVNYVLSKHERIIVLEDDCVPAQDYVEFMETCFDKYENVDKVMSISGYSWPVEVSKNYKYDIYFCYRLSSWGWGTWRRAWKYFRRDSVIYKEILESYDLYMNINRAGRDLVLMLEAQLNKQIDSWAVYWAINIAMNSGVCINPVKSKIDNIGFDGTGVHCDKDTDIFKVNLVHDENNKLLLPNKINIDSSINIQIEKLLFKSLTTDETSYRYKKYYLLLNKWIQNINNGIHISKYLINNDIHSVVIYGMGEVGNRLEEELKDSEISIIKKVDNSTLTELKGIKVDAIIVTPIFDYNNIKNEINNINCNIKVISLEDVIY